MEIGENIKLSFSLGFVEALTLTFLLLFFSKRRSVFLDRKDIDEPQKFHSKPTPRAGGLGIFLSYFSIGLLQNISLYISLLVVSLFPFLVGVLEDFKRHISPKIRLLGMGLGALLGILVFGKLLIVQDVGFVKLPMFLAVPFTIFAIVGFTNAINIIDGFNGLASGIAMLILFFLGLAFYNCGDFQFYSYCLLLIGSILGFFILNFPKGKIFLGDGGAYFLGFIIAMFSIFLINLHPEISPWFPFALGIYPVWEVIFSILRKKFIRGISPTQPDKVHFHMLIYNRLTKNNPLTSVVIWALNLPFMVAAYIFRHDGIILALIALAFCLVYLIFYKLLVSFKTSKLKKIFLP